MIYKRIALDQPAEYKIKVQERLTFDFSDWFVGEVDSQVESGENGQAVTVLVGVVRDQTALHGLLKQIRDMSMTLLLVECLSAQDKLV